MLSLKIEYIIQDGVKYKKPVHLPAPEYIALLMDWIESQINDESLFPVTTDIPFPKVFQPQCKKILTRLYRVFVHVYVHHFDRIMSIGQFFYFISPLFKTNFSPYVEMFAQCAKFCWVLLSLVETESVNDPPCKDATL